MSAGRFMGGPEKGRLGIDFIFVAREIVAVLLLSPAMSMVLSDGFLISVIVDIETPY